MTIQRRFTQPGVDPLDTIDWDRRSSVIREPDGTVVFEMHDIEVPKVAHPSRVHLDIETDDIDAEVRRLEALGARRLESVKSWVVTTGSSGAGAARRTAALSRASNSSMPNGFVT